MFAMGTKAYLGLGAAALGGKAWGGLAKFAGTQLGKRALWGAGVGGAYGAFSDNTSMIGGALTGAAIGAAGPSVARVSRAGINAARYTRGGAAQRAAAGAFAMGRASRRMFGSAMNRAVNPISGLGSAFLGF